MVLFAYCLWTKITHPAAFPAPYCSRKGQQMAPVRILSLSLWTRIAHTLAVFPAPHCGRKDQQIILSPLTPVHPYSLPSHRHNILPKGSNSNHTLSARASRWHPPASCSLTRIAQLSCISRLVFWPQGPARSCRCILSPDQNRTPPVAFPASIAGPQAPTNAARCMSVTGPGSHTLAAFPLPSFHHFHTHVFSPLNRRDGYIVMIIK